MILFVFIVFVGCNSKEARSLAKSLEKEKNYHRQLQKSEKVQLYDGHLTKTMLIATYLNKQEIDKDAKNNERFIVGIYSEDENKTSFKNGDYSLTLNNKEPISIISIKKDNPLLKDISFTSDWSKFYLVSFEHVSTNKFSLIFKSKLYGKGILNFAKVAKYKFEKKTIF